MISRPDRRALGLLTLLLLITCLPFVQRAYFVDDYYFVTMAKGILQHPARPYDFISDDDGIGNMAWERGKAPRMVNPPLFHYFLAAVMAGWGDEIWKLRTASLLFPLISLFCVYFLGKRFVRDSLAAASLLAITPAFWLTSYALLIDSALLSFFLAALVCFIEGQEQKKLGLIILSGLLMGMALLTKYTGILILPVSWGWHLLHRERCSWARTFLSSGICAVLLLAWGVWGMATYGQMHFIAVLSRGYQPTTYMSVFCLGMFVAGCYVRWSVQNPRASILGSWVFWAPCAFLAIRAQLQRMPLVSWLKLFYLDKSIAVASFLSGSSVFILFAWILLYRRDKRVAGTMAVVGGLLYLCFSSRYGGFDVLQSAQLAFFVGSTMAFLAVLGLTLSPKSDRQQLFLFAWLVMGLLELVVVMPWTAVRYLLVILPPACWLFQSVIESTGRRFLWRFAWGVTAMMGVTLAYVDYARAGVVIPLTRVLDAQRATWEHLSPRPRHHWYYLADTFDGSLPYLQKMGWESVFPFQTFTRGSLFLRANYRQSSWWKLTNPQRFQLLKAWEFESRIPLSVMDVPASAGFYASCWGVLPYVFTRHPLERFELYIVN